MFLLLLGCTVIKGSGDLVSEARDVSGADAISNSIFVEVEFTPAAETSATLTCDENLIEHITTEVEDGELRIRERPDLLLRPTSACVLELSAPCMRSVHLSGSGGFSSDEVLCTTSSIHVSGSGGVDIAGVDSDALEVHGSGAGRIQLGALDVGTLDVHFTGSGGGDASGACGHADVDLSSSGGFFAQGLACDTADIHVSGAGGVELTVNEAATVDTSGSGGVDLWGDATVEANSTGSGEVRQH